MIILNHVSEFNSYSRKTLSTIKKTQGCITYAAEKNH